MYRNGSTPGLGVNRKPDERRREGHSADGRRQWKDDCRFLCGLCGQTETFGMYEGLVSVTTRELALAHTVSARTSMWAG
jgi:hypothetical protein